jgi:hypothetical protein
MDGTEQCKDARGRFGDAKMEIELPTFREIAAQRLADAGPRDKTIDIKVAIRTARAMVEAENREAAALAWVFGHCELRDGDGFSVNRDDVYAAVRRLGN